MVCRDWKDGVSVNDVRQLHDTRLNEWSCMREHSKTEHSNRTGGHFLLICIWKNRFIKAVKAQAILSTLSKWEHSSEWGILSVSSVCTFSLADSNVMQGHHHPVPVVRVPGKKLALGALNHLGHWHGTCTRPSHPYILALAAIRRSQNTESGHSSRWCFCSDPFKERFSKAFIHIKSCPCTCPTESLALLCVCRLPLN